MTRAQREQSTLPLQIPLRISADGFLPLRVIPISAPGDSRERKQGLRLHVTVAGSDARGSGAKKGLLRHLQVTVPDSPHPACTLGSGPSLPRVPHPSGVLPSSPFPVKQLQSPGQSLPEKTLQGLERLPPCSHERK